MATITGTSSSCMGLISTEGNSTSCLTLDTLADLAGEFQILPRLALVGRRAQQIGGVTSHAQRHFRKSQARTGPAHEGLTLAVLLGTRRFADDQPICRLVAHAEHGLSTRVAQRTTRARGHPRPKLRPIHAGFARGG